jgi:hypothetical protein
MEPVVFVVVVVVAREKWFEVIWIGEGYGWRWLKMIEETPFSKYHLFVVVLVMGMVVVWIEFLVHLARGRVDRS